MKTLMLTLALALTVGCGGDDSDTPKDAALPVDGKLVDAPTDIDGGIDAFVPDADCFMNPQTNNEIINACTTAQRIKIDFVPPLTLPDGGLPPLPPSP